MKLVTVVGARPQFIKAAALSRELRAREEIQEVLVHTGQHYDENMSAVFFEELEIPRPDVHLQIGSASHGVQTGRMLEALESTFAIERPDWVLVYGDTNSTLAGALAAAKLHIPVAHVEAGLRSFNKRMPEEINRVLTDHVSELLFAPTQAAVENLRREGIDIHRVRLTGDVMYDAALFYGAKSDERSGILGSLGLRAGTYALATVHRAENTDDLSRLTAIVQGLLKVAEQLPVVLPIHPRTKRALVDHGLMDILVNKLNVIEPVGYLDMVQLERHASVIVTDSGGVQKEAYFYRVPCVTLRDETEWIELIETGWNRLVPPRDAESIAHWVLQAIGSQGRPVELYGGGLAARRIAEVLLSQ